MSANKSYTLTACLMLPYTSYSFASILQRGFSRPLSPAEWWLELVEESHKRKSSSTIFMYAFS